MAESKTDGPIEQPTFARRYRGPRFFWGLIVLLAIVVLLFALSFGWHWHRMAYGPTPYWDDGYGRHMGMMGFRDSSGYSGYMMFGSGVSGAIKQITGAQITVTAANGIEETVLVDAQTQISKSGASAKITDLKAGDNITVSGFPNGVNQIQARIITVQ